jgi:phosphoglucosamine mutase
MTERHGILCRAEADGEQDQSTKQKEFRQLLDLQISEWKNEIKETGIMGKYFGTDGFRGEANVKLTVEHAFQVGRYLGWYYGQDYKARIVIGKDTRRSSYMFEYALAAGLTASGADAFLLHVTTTPSVSYVVRTEDFDCGIMISASHNPYYDNGLKIISGSGKKIEAHIEQQIEDYIDGKIGELPLATGEKIGRTIDYVAGRNRYIGHLISLATRSFKNTKVALDCSNGSSSSIAKSVFDALGAKTYVINNEPDGTNINRDCGSTHIEVLQRYVVENGMDVGFAYDGDADRCIAVDETGRVIDGDLIMYVCGKQMKEEGKLPNNTIVTTVMSNLGLYKALDKAGIAYEKTAVGDKYVYENMCANGHGLGGEQSGHIIFSKHATTGDGILTSIMVMEVMMEKKVSLGTLAAEVKIYPQLLKNVRVHDKKTARENPAVMAAVARVEQTLGDDGRILVRESGTEPVIRVMVEAETDELCKKYVDEVVDTIVSEGLTE